jgi:uncharacterized protein YhaN
MRLQNLNLVRFGKFTDTDILLPNAEHDFHLIVGPNEAGKSTVRGAIADLLFGFPPRYAAMAFVHQQAELCLAATVMEGDEGSLAVVRTKGNRNTLRTPADVPLPDNALLPFIGPADRAFFEIMFGLSHAQLVAGGELILDASKDVSQVLFQSAAGLAGLGKVKDGLIAEADRLWAPRHSGSRTYYIASDQLDQATKDLKVATVRSKSFGDARSALDDVESRIEATTERKGQLQATRLKLERVRRLAPKVVELKQRLAELEALGEVLDLPANALKTLNEGEQDLSVAETTLRQCELAVRELTEQRDQVVFDAAVLASREDIQALAATGESVRNHYSGLVTRQVEVDRCLELAGAAAKDLGWPDSNNENALRSRLPTQLSVREVHRLVNEHGGLLQSKTSTEEIVANKTAELEEAEAELNAIAVAEISPTLRSALSAAQAYRNSAQTQSKADSAVRTAKRAFDTAQADLGQWRRAVEELHQMSPPSSERLSGLVAKRQRLDSELSTAVDRVEQAERGLADARLDVTQFAEARHIVTGSDVREARQKRDADWRAIKDGTTPLASGAPGLDAAINLADELVDTQLGSTTDAAQLQSLKQQVERAEAELTAATQATERKADQLRAFDEDWVAETVVLALPGLALADAQAWMVKRELVLSAFATLGEKEEALRQEVSDAAAVATALSVQLGQAGLSVPADSTLAAILTAAEDLVSEADSSAARRGQLVKQRNAGKIMLGRLQTAADAAYEAFAEWEGKWAAAVVGVGLAEYVKAVGDAEQALAKVEAVRQNLEKATAIRRDRIDTMNRDLDEFAKLAAGVVDALGIQELRGVDARDVVRALSPRLKEAEAGESRRAAAQDALASANKQRDAARDAVEHVKARVAPLLAAAGVASLAEAAPLVAKSEDKRRLVQEIELARGTLTQGSDGLALDVVIAEVEACDLAQVAVDLTSVDDQIERVLADQTSLASEHTQAKMVVAAFGGGRDAAIAEARRQEALAGMADASERYIKVTAAAKLLSWAIERYREQNQGPMLTRAGAIFSALTLGRYTKLFVDFDITPYQLSAVRTDGKAVEVSGMSEGTRDQLYLALRLAALELHLAKAKALPFVADDLFINFDDERSTAGLQALRDLSTKTQVLFLTHHDHLLPRVQQVFGSSVNVVHLQR